MPKERKARLNERRLAALYRLSRMDDASEQELAYFVLKEIMRITGSRDGFFFLPDQGEGGRDRFLLSSGHRLLVDKENLSEDCLAKEALALAVSGTGKKPRKVLWNGGAGGAPKLLLDGKISLRRYLICPVLHQGRCVCLAGVCNKRSDYDKDDMRQLESFARNAWGILRRHWFFHELQRAQMAAEAAGRAKDKFLANINHALRTPLNGILGTLHLLQQAPLPAEAAELVNGALDSGKALVRIISDILDFSRLESDSMELVPNFFSFQDSVQSCAALFRKEADSKGLFLLATLDPDIPPTLVGDDARLRQVLFNLLDNAVKFTEQGGIAVDCALLSPKKTMLERGSALVEVRVSDTGIGISPDKYNLVFEPFAQGGRALNRRSSGSGLGLNLVQNLVRMMGGRVNLVSKEKSGTTVSFTLLFSLPESRESLVPAPAADVEPQHSLDILVVEDDAVSRLAIGRFLERAGYRVFCVENGKQGLEALQIYPFHCLVTDIRMPGMDGVELATRIRQGEVWGFPPSEEVRQRLESEFGMVLQGQHGVKADLIIVSVSAHMVEGDEKLLLKQGMDYCLAKPLVVRELRELLRNIAARIVATGPSGAA